MAMLIFEEVGKVAAGVATIIKAKSYGGGEGGYMIFPSAVRRYWRLFRRKSGALAEVTGAAQRKDRRYSDFIIYVIFYDPALERHKKLMAYLQMMRKKLKSKDIQLKVEREYGQGAFPRREEIIF